MHLLYALPSNTEPTPVSLPLLCLSPSVSHSLHASNLNPAWLRHFGICLLLLGLLYLLCIGKAHLLRLLLLNAFIFIIIADICLSTFLLLVLLLLRTWLFIPSCNYLFLITPSPHLYAILDFVCGLFS